MLMMDKTVFNMLSQKGASSLNTRDGSCLKATQTFIIFVQIVPKIGVLCGKMG